MKYRNNDEIAPLLLRKSHSKKILKYLFFISSVTLLLNFVLMSQSIKKEKINSLIKELTPSYSLQKSLNENLEIIGYDVLDENMNRLTSSKLTFFPGSQFYVVLYTTRKIIKGVTLKENELNYLVAIYYHENRGYFRSFKTTYLIGEQEIEIVPKEWQIGGIYKIRFTFKVPEFALPRKYILELRNERSVYAGETIIIIDAIKINIIREKIAQREITEDYNLALEGCLLKTAVQRKADVAFFWAGNIEFFIDKDIRNFKKIIIRARGTSALGIYPLLKIYVDKKEIGNVYVNSEWRKYEFDLKLDKEGHILKVRFDNDAAAPGEDRNMYVNMIKLVR